MQTISNPKVSVVLAVYNEEEHIHAAVESLLNQTMTELEIVVVDDGSDDQTPEILASFNDRRLRILKQNRGGQYSALVYGIENAKGKYIARLDADDVAYPERISLQLAYLELHPKCGWLGTGEERSDTQRDEHTARLYPENDQAIRRMAAKCIPYCHSSVMFPKSVVKAGFNYRRNGGFMSDFVFFQEVASRWEVANLPEILVRRRIRDESFYQKNYGRNQQNRRLAMLNLTAAWRFGLLPHHYCFPVARLFYLLLPTSVKRVVRRFAGINERRIASDQHA